MVKNGSKYLWFVCIVFMYTNYKLHSVKKGIQEKQIDENNDIIVTEYNNSEDNVTPITIQNQGSPPVRLEAIAITTTSSVENETIADKDEDEAKLVPPIVQIQKLEICETTIKLKCKERHSGFKRNVSTEVLDHDQILKEHPDIAMGGSWKPSNCVSNSRIALIIPYRNRETHLKLMIRNVIPFLKAQNKSFTIFVIEQVGPEVFNKGQLMNAGFIESQKLGHYTCFIFHDVDMVPLNLCNVYECPNKGMRHLGLSRDLKKPHIEWNRCIGGASAFTDKVFRDINGFTNEMFGWGGEDDDGYFRLIKSHIPVHRYNVHIGNYVNFKHSNDSLNPKSLRNREAVIHYKYMKYDGLNSLYYRVINIYKERLLTRILVHIPGPRSASSLRSYFKAKIREFQSLLYEEMSKTTTVKSSEQIDKKTMTAEPGEELYTKVGYQSTTSNQDRTTTL